LAVGISLGFTLFIKLLTKTIQIMLQVAELAKKNAAFLGLKEHHCFKNSETIYLSVVGCLKEIY